MLTLEDLKDQIKPSVGSQLFYGLLQKRDTTGPIDTIKWEMVNFTEDSFHKFNLLKKQTTTTNVPNLELAEAIEFPKESIKDKFKKYYLNETK